LHPPFAIFEKQKFLAPEKSTEKMHHSHQHMINYDATGTWTSVKGFGSGWKRWESERQGKDPVTGMLRLAPNKKKAEITMYLDTGEKGKGEIIASGLITDKTLRRSFHSEKEGSLGFIGPSSPRADVWGEGIEILASLEATNTNLFNYSIFGTVT